MGTRINVLLEHDLTDYRDRDSVMARLVAALPAASAVQNYWHSADPDYPHEKLSEWRADPVSSCDPNLHRYTAPGNLFLTLTKQAAKIRTGARWRGFLTIEPLRRVHLAAFRQIAAALKSRSLVVYADSCEVDDLFWGGHTQRECVERMARMWGPPQRNVEEIEPRNSVWAKLPFPFIWFLENSQLSAEQGIAPGSGGSA
jgi:hypothetical protein